jgi:hypothetical protein
MPGLRNRRFSGWRREIAQTGGGDAWTGEEEMPGMGGDMPRPGGRRSLDWERYA